MAKHFFQIGSEWFTDKLYFTESKKKKTQIQNLLRAKLIICLNDLFYFFFVKPISYHVLKNFHA